MPLKSKSSAKDGRKAHEQTESDHISSHIQRLEEEKAGLLRRVRALHAWSKKELETLRDQLTEVKAQKDRASKDDELLNQLSSAILSLYIEMKDRKAARVTVELEAEAQRLSNTNPLVILTYLRTHLRVLLAAQEDHEQAMRDQIAAARREVASMEQVLQERLGEAAAREAQVTSPSVHPRPFPLPSPPPLLPPTPVLSLPLLSQSLPAHLVAIARVGDVCPQYTGACACSVRARARARDVRTWRLRPARTRTRMPRPQQRALRLHNPRPVL